MGQIHTSVYAGGIASFRIRSTVFWSVIRFPSWPT